ncbi:uncharacterized protein LOC123541752 isoform X1 [Mercenaria mercenaria]|uniref:uncharacterized protein LOC123541752 isoform X1 n=1 Tax=Mercenaria mercenaria TaxID=6596 RepID=UPI00234EA40C|nr:uncharacterized protein LOC123541752 isoform X1 [Mercenaria mercenaria]
MAESLSHADILRTFGKFLRDEKHKIDAEYVTHIKPLISEIRYEKYTFEELHELVISINNVLESLEIKGSVGNVESDLQKALVELERAKCDALKPKSEVRKSMLREESGRRLGEGLRNDSGCFSADSRVLSSGSILVTQPSDADLEEDNSSTSRAVNSVHTEPTQHEDTSQLLNKDGDSIC